VRRVADVAGEGDDLGADRQLGAGGLEGLLAPGVDDEAPAAPGQLARQREAEAP